MMQPTPQQIFGNYVAWEAKPGTWFINFMNGSQNMYLLEGNDRAMLIDTGWGAGNLRAFVEKLTNKPLIVVNTHYHPDHSAGNGEFEEVFVSSNYLIDAPSVDTPGTGPFDLSQMPHPDYRKSFLYDGDQIDLGGRVIDVIEAAPAHCNSSLFFIDRAQNLIFTGDEYEAAQTMLYDNSNNPDAPYEVSSRVDHLRDNAQKLLSLCDDQTWILPNHNGYPLTKAYLEEYVSLADAIYAGTAVIEDKLNHPFAEMDPKAPQLCRVRYGRVSIFIKKAEVLKIYGGKN